MADDYPREVEEIRKALLSLTQDKKKASFEVDKLIINEQVYHGPNTQKLPLYTKIMSSLVWLFFFFIYKLFAT